jgi:hypothetical protein
MPAPGYIVNLEVIPPLIFPFQFNPEIVSEKKSFKYNSVQNFGEWKFDQAGAGAAPGGVGGFFGGAAGIWRDVQEWGSLLTATKPLEPQEGEPRSIGLEFSLDATEGPYNAETGGTRDIRNDLAVLRSFMYPNYELTSFLPELISSGKFPCWNRPPVCSFHYGGVSMTGYVTDLHIKLVDFNADGTPIRAEVNMTIKEQTQSISTITDTLGRYWNVLKSYNSPHIKGFAKDYGEAFISPFVSAFGD